MEPIPISEIVESLHLKPFTLNTKDKLYIFGRNPELSLAETISCYNGAGAHPSILDLSDQGIIIHSDTGTHIRVNNTGSVLKRAKPILYFPKPISMKDITKKLFEYFNDNIYMEEKAHWGLSLYNEPDSSTANRLYDDFQTIIKKTIKKIGIKRVFFRKPMEGLQLEPLHLNRKDILEVGFELILWNLKSGLIIAQTEEVLDVDQFEVRDTERRHRRPLYQIGLALARSMINLVSIEENRHTLPVYDPFCGIATIPQEAYLLNFATFGSDIDAQTVKQAKQNMGQFLYNLSVEKKEGHTEPEIFKMDIVRPKIEKFKEFDGSIVSEPDLLQPLKSYPSRNEADSIQKQFILNYHDYLDGIDEILHSGQVVVMVFPQIHLKGNRRLPLPIDLLLKEHGFELCYFTVNSVGVPCVFVHDWKEPIIERQIIVFKKS